MAASAGRLEQVLERGPYPHLSGTVLRQEWGNLTAGAFAAPAAGDWNGNGLPALVAGSGYGDLLFFQRRTDGLLEEPVQMMPEPLSLLPRPPAPRPVSPVMVDWDGDGRQDLLVGVGGTVYFYRRTPDGLAPPAELMVNGRGVGESVRALLPDCGHLAPTVADIDLDGVTDLLLGDDRGNVWWLGGQATEGAPRLGAPALLGHAGEALNVGGRARVAAGDWTGNGYPDLFIGSRQGTVYLCTGSEAGLAAPVPFYGPGATVDAPDTASLRDTAPTLTHWQGRGGRPRLLVGDRRGFVALLAPGDSGSPVVEGYLQAAGAPVDVGRAAAVTAVDWNGDGLLDLVVGGEDGYVHLFQRVRDNPPLFSSGRRVGATDGPVRAAGREELEDHLRFAWPCVTDANGSGALDLVLGQADGRVALWLNNGGLRPAGHITVADSELVVPGLTTVHAVDYDHDGDTDLFVGTRLIPALPAEGRLWPEGIVYLENVAPRRGHPPLFVKAVRLDIFIAPPEGGDARDADMLGVSVLQPVHWSRRGTLDFLLNTRYGAYVAQTETARRAYPRLEIRAAGRGMPIPVLPPAWSHTAARLTGGDHGILCGLEEVGWVVWYERDALPATPH